MVACKESKVVALTGHIKGLLVRNQPVRKAGIRNRIGFEDISLAVHHALLCVHKTAILPLAS
jgi:hypothetical protein